LSAGPLRIVLVGLPGSGKSTVGPLLAAALGWELVDTDAEVERAAGMSITRIFAREGEPAFRAREAAAVEGALGRERVVIAPGGGWIEGAGDLAALPPRTLVVHLRIGAEEAAARLAGAAGARPLLHGGDVAGRLHELEERRLPLYRRADVEIWGSGDPEQVCGRIVALLSPLPESTRD
jgi:shikimate kinase